MYKRIFKEVYSGNFSQSAFFFFDKSDFEKAWDIVKSNVESQRTSKINGYLGKYIIEYIPVTYKKNAIVIDKLLSKANIKYDWIKY